VDGSRETWLVQRRGGNVAHDAAHVSARRGLEDVEVCTRHREVGEALAVTGARAGCERPERRLVSVEPALDRRAELGVRRALGVERVLAEDLDEAVDALSAARVGLAVPFEER
jgi:hypothetical protein